jgi:hypothetical protein
MLRRTLAAVAVVLAATIASIATAVPAAAATGGGCSGTKCWVVVTGPSVPGTKGGGSDGGGGSSGPQVCYFMDGQVKIIVTCFLGPVGGYDQADGCYYRQAIPQPPTSDPVWQGHTPDQGAIYEHSCLTAFGGTNPVYRGQIFLSDPPPVAGAGPTPAQVAAEALADLTVGAPEIGTAPQTAGHGLVGLPVWLWTDRNVQTWGPIPVSKTDGRITVNVQADAQYIVWDTGDGHSVRCANPGTSFAITGGASASPTCGYRYLTPSRNQPGGIFTVTATTHWQVVWSANTGDGGTLTTDVPSTTTITIDELEVVTS